MGHEASSLYYSPSTTPGGYIFYLTHGTQPLSQPLSLPSSINTSTGSMAPRADNTIPSAEGNITVAGPEYRQGSGSEESHARSIPPPSKFKIYYAAPEVENRDFDGWENKLCFPLPISDVGTCCAAEWIPCYLFGKSNWRLEQLRERKDPSNKSYKAGQGCNIWCWTWAGLQVFHCGWIGTGFQRNRVRATYGIKGTCFNDFVTAYFCNCCVLMQTDREIQAREGRTSFITNKEYDPKEKLKQEASNSQQPIHMQRMRYLSGGDTGDPTSILDGTSPSKKINVDPKKSTPFPEQGAVPSHRNSKVGSAYRNAKSEPPHRKTSDFTWSDFSLYPKNKSPTTQSIHSPKDLSQSRSVSLFPNKKPYSLGGLEDTTGSARPDEITQPRTHTQSSSTHAEEQSQTDSVQEASRRSSDTLVQNWRHNSGKGPSKRSKLISSAGKSTKMSYVHDFTDCPIDKSVLDYYDRQQRRIDENQQQKGVRDTSPGNTSTTSPSATPTRRYSKNVKQLDSSARDKATEEVTPSTEASERNNTRGSTKTTFKTFDSHALGDCPQANGMSGETSKSQGPVEHSVDQCPQHLDGTSSDVGERRQSPNTNNGEPMTGSSSPWKEELVQTPSSEFSKVASNGEMLAQHKQSGVISRSGSFLTASIMDGTEKATKDVKGARLDENLILSHKDIQWDVDNQQDLRDAVSKAFPVNFNKDCGTPVPQSLHGSQGSRPESTLEHILGETRVNSVVAQEQGLVTSLPAIEIKEVNEKNGRLA